ncbi:MAG TPA: CPBP family glutamic-type intramembrane protease [Chloroflexia bacterium]|nr:CPBP family glutamic-type intramembrane protease [Chloroflexia bacterium]
MNYNNPQQDPSYGRPPQQYGQPNIPGQNGNYNPAGNQSSNAQYNSPNQSGFESSKLRLPGPTQANLCFLLAIIVFLGLSIVAEVAKWGFALTSVTGEAGLAIVAILFCVLGGYNFRETFSLHKTSLLTLFLCALAGFAGQFAVRFPAALNEWIMSFFGPFPIEDLIPNPKDNFSRVILFVVLVVVAPLCEETLNRGFVLAGYRRLGFGKTILFVGLLFGIFHLYPFRFAYTFLLGMGLAYLVLVTRSIYSSMAAHLGFNFIGGLSPWLLDWLNQSNNNNLVEESSKVDLQTVVATIPLSLLGGAIFFLLLRSVTRRTAKKHPELVLGYFGLARGIRSDFPPGATATGPYYGPDPRYQYGPYGYIPAGNNPPNQGYPQAPGGYYPNAQNYPVYGQQGYNWANNLPQATAQAPLTSLQRIWWQLSLLIVLLLYCLTGATEILTRQHNGQKQVTSPPTPGNVVTLPPSDVRVVTANGLHYMIVNSKNSHVLP